MTAGNLIKAFTLGTALLLAPLASYAGRVWDHDPYAIADLGSTTPLSPAYSKQGHRVARTSRRRLPPFVAVESSPASTYKSNIRVLTYDDDLDTSGSNPVAALKFYYDQKVGSGSRLTDYPNANGYLVDTPDTLDPNIHHIEFKQGIVDEVKRLPNISHPHKLFVVATLTSDPKQPHCVAVFTLVKQADTARLLDTRATRK